MTQYTICTIKLQNFFYFFLIVLKKLLACLVWGRLVHRCCHDSCPHPFCCNFKCINRIWIVVPVACFVLIVVVCIIFSTSLNFWKFDWSGYAIVVFKFVSSRVDSNLPGDLQLSSKEIQIWIFFYPNTCHLILKLSVHCICGCVIQAKKALLGLQFWQYWGQPHSLKQCLLGCWKGCCQQLMNQPHCASCGREGMRRGSHHHRSSKSGTSKGCCLIQPEGQLNVEFFDGFHCQRGCQHGLRLHGDRASSENDRNNCGDRPIITVATPTTASDALPEPAEHASWVPNSPFFIPSCPWSWSIVKRGRYSFKIPSGLKLWIITMSWAAFCACSRFLVHKSRWSCLVLLMMAWWIGWDGLKYNVW